MCARLMPEERLIGAPSKLTIGSLDISLERAGNSEPNASVGCVPICRARPYPMGYIAALPRGVFYQRVSNRLVRRRERNTFCGGRNLIRSRCRGTYPKL
jgi:hypothetical protein